MIRLVFKTINEIEALREKSITEMPNECRTLYSYAMQVLTMPIDVTKRQNIHRNLLYAVEEADKGNYDPLREERQYLIDISIKM